MTDKKPIDEVMQAMPESWRTYWCEAEVCACMGGANCSGQLKRLGYSKQEWQQWIDSRAAAEIGKGMA